MNELVTDEDGNNGGGSITFVQSFIGNSTLAGMVGWTLLIGYIGLMAMYAFAFGEFAIALPLVPESLSSLSLRLVISVLTVAGFVGLNLLGARATGSAENVLNTAKIFVLMVFGVSGILYVLFVSPDSIPPRYLAVHVVQSHYGGGRLLRRLPGVATIILRSGEYGRSAREDPEGGVHCHPGRGIHLHHPESTTPSRKSFSDV